MTRPTVQGRRGRLALAVGLLAGLAAGSGCGSSPRASVEASSRSVADLSPKGLGDAAKPSQAQPDWTVAGEPAGVAPEATPPESAVIRLAPGVEVDLRQREVRIAAQAALDEGWLEQAVCLAGTREHESLLAIEAPPRLVHAALLLIGLEPGRPGSWSLADDGITVRREPPTGDAIEVWARFEAEDGSVQTVPLSAWVETARGDSIAEHPWRFAGSRLEPARNGGEIYAADFGGSVIGLVTFGDEVISFEEVRSDRVEIEEAGFLVRRGAPPPPGTPVTLLVRNPRAP